MSWALAADSSFRMSNCKPLEIQRCSRRMRRQKSTVAV
jgi:hypothetical protein